MVFRCKFGRNLPISPGDRVPTRLIFTVFIVWWPSKLGHGHQNLINSFNFSSDTIHTVWPESIIWIKRKGVDKLFRSKYDIQSAGVTVKMRSRSPTSNHFFPCPNNVSKFGQNPPTGSGKKIRRRRRYLHQKQYVPSPPPQHTHFGSGDMGT